jgi:hypothetical protein
LTVSRWEQGLNIDDGVKGSGAMGATYNLGDKFNFVAGVAVSSRMVGNGVTVNPFGQFTWKIDERNTFSTAGLGLQLRSRWNKAITTNIYAKYAGRRFRLDDRNDGVVNKGSLRDLGVVAYRQLKTTDEDGDTVDTTTSNAPGVYGSLVLRKKF